MNESRVKEELSMLTGVVSNDITYLFYLLLTDGIEDGDVRVEDRYVKTEKVVLDTVADSIDEWFMSLEVVR